MSDTYKKVHIHLIFAVKNRDALLHKSWRKDLFAYISKSIKNRGHFTYAVNGYHDHIHILFDYNLNELIPDLVREIKKSSTKFIQEKKYTRFKFQWQSGYGIFSVGWRELDNTIKYIMNQEEHHKKRSFKEEYMSILNKYDIEFKQKYIFEFLDD